MVSASDAKRTGRVESSTGKPKGVQHSTGGYLLGAILSMQWVFDAKPDSDVYWCTADVGWITGHTYVAYGPLALGMTEVIFEGIPTYPHAGRFWETIAKHKVTTFYTAPTAIRSLIKLGHDLPAQVSTCPRCACWARWASRSTRRPGCGTTRSSAAAAAPSSTPGGRPKPAANMISPLPGAVPTKPGSCTLPLPGIMAAITDEHGHPVEKGQGGYLVIQRPFPSQLRTLWGDPDRFKKTYFPEELGGKTYLAGDSAHRDKDGYFWIMGRIDDVLNVSGHRLGTMEIESALVSNPRVAEAAVVGRPHDIKGEAVVAYVVLKGTRPVGEEARKIAAELRDWVGKEIGPIAKPDEIRFGDNLPKTRSGKIMRRLLRAIAKGEEITQDISTLENPAILEQLKEAVK